MNICCLYCGCEKMARCFDPSIVDREVNQTLKRRVYECAGCGETGVLMWWEVWLNGKTLISPVSGFQWKSG